MKRSWLLALGALVAIVGAAAACHRLYGFRTERLKGVAYRARGRHPDENVPDLVLADRVRSTIGPLERRLDIPHVHVMVHDHVVTLHGDVPSRYDVERLTGAIGEISGVRGVRSFLHVGLIVGDTRPSEGREKPPRSTQLTELLAAARRGGAKEAPVFAVHAVMDTFLAHMPRSERYHLLAHLPHDVRVLAEPAELHGNDLGPTATADDVARAVASADPRLDVDSARTVTEEVLQVLHQFVPEESASIAAALPAPLRSLWIQAGAASSAG